MTASSPTTTHARVARRGASAVTIAIAVMNLTAYVFTLITSRVLGPSEFGAFSALVAIFLVINVVALGLQTTGARRLSIAHGDHPDTRDALLRLTHRTALLLTVLCLVAAPFVQRVLRLDSITPALLLAATVGLQTLFFGQTGVLQGERRWVSLALVFAANGVGRLLVGIAALLWRQDATGAMLGLAAGSFLPLLAGWLGVRRMSHGDARAQISLRDLTLELAHSSHALLAFFAVSSADILVARVALDSHQAGLYAAGLIVVKSVLFMPQFVIVLAFPGLAAGGRERGRQRARAVLVIGGLGLLAILAVTVLRDLAVAFVGGAEYAEVSALLPWFAVLGTVLSLIQIFVYDLLANESRIAVGAVWFAFFLLITSVFWVDGKATLLFWVIVVDLVLLVAMIVLSLRHSTQEHAAAHRASHGRSAA